MRDRGRLVCIEGIDSAGKHTQAVRLAEALDGVVMSFPNYETETGKIILDNLQHRWEAAAITEHVVSQIAEGVNLVQRTHHDDAYLNALALQAIFTVNRYEAASKIEDLLLSGRNVVLDRYWPSGVVYGSCDGLDEQWLTRIHERLPQPDFWILLDVDPAESVLRRPERRDRYEKDANMGRRREIYLRLFAGRLKDTTGFLVDQDETEYRSKWAVVDGAGHELEVHGRIRAKLREHFGRDFIDDKGLKKGV